MARRTIGPKMTLRVPVDDVAAAAALVTTLSEHTGRPENTSSVLRGAIHLGLQLLSGAMVQYERGTVDALDDIANK